MTHSSSRGAVIGCGGACESTFGLDTAEGHIGPGAKVQESGIGELEVIEVEPNLEPQACRPDVPSVRRRGLKTESLW